MRLRFCIVLFLAPGLLCSAQTKRALLIGIDTYQPAGTSAEHPAGCAYGRCELGTFLNLNGAVNDAQSMADLLTSPKFGFPAGQVVLLTNPAPPQPGPGLTILPAAQTDRAGILAAMQKYLVDLPGRGDTVVFYDASHGSLRVNSQGNKITVVMNGVYVHADSTLVPADAYKGGFDVRDREMTRIFQAALDKGVHLTVIFDSCHSGGATRGAAGHYRARSLAYDPRDIKEAPETLPNGRPRLSPTERTDNPALVFSAAQQDQEAEEADPTTAMPEPHGAFTAALLETLEVLPADAPASLVYQRVKAVMEGNSNLGNQEPDLDATAARRRQPLFSTSAKTSDAAMQTAVLKTDPDGSVWLDIGRVSGVGIGSEFAAARTNGQGAPVRLRVSALQGISRSTAQVVSPEGAKVRVGDVFELTKWVPARSAALTFWTWPANLSEAEIGDVVAQVKLAGVNSVKDPAEEPWTEMLFWNGNEWCLQPVPPKIGNGSNAPIDLDRKPDAPTVLGEKLSAEMLKRHLPPGAKVWVNLPPSRELAAGLTPHDANSAVQEAPDLASAGYLLAGTISEGSSAYAWYRKAEFDAGPHAKIETDHDPGCSATSQYPVRSDWVTLSGLHADAETAAKLNHYASLLAKVHGWLELADNPTDASADRYYRLALVHPSDSALLSPDHAAAQDEELRLALKADAPVSDRRWVYVLDISCHGQGTLLYPRDLTENRFPSDADMGLEFILPGSPTLQISEPYGVDTLVMLDTAQPLTDPYALEFEGVTSRGGGNDSPLARLLSDASRGTRGAPAPVPTDWGIDLLTLHSVPNKQAQ